MIRVGVLSECQHKLSLIFRTNGYGGLTSQLYKLQDLKAAISAYNILAKLLDSRHFKNSRTEF